MSGSCLARAQDPELNYVHCTRKAGHTGKHRAKLRDYAVAWKNGDKTGVLLTEEYTSIQLTKSTAKKLKMLGKKGDTYELIILHLLDNHINPMIIT